MFNADYGLHHAVWKEQENQNKKMAKMSHLMSNLLASKQIQGMQLYLRGSLKRERADVIVLHPEVSSPAVPAAGQQVNLTAGSWFIEEETYMFVMFNG